MEQISSGQRAQRSGRLATLAMITTTTTTTRATVVAFALIFVILAAWLMEPSVAAAPLLEARQDQLPDSIYRQAPLLFGADIIGDYYTEPAEEQPTMSPPTKTTASKKTSSSYKTASSGNNNKFALSNTKTTTTKSPRLKRNPAREAASATASVQELMLSGTKGGVSMDHVINSLGLVVEAMRQQTMAMQMISGQMASTKSGTPSDKGERPEEKQQAAERLHLQQQQSQADARALLESFGEVLSGIKGANPTASSSATPSSPSARSRAVLESLSEIMSKTSGKISSTQQALEEPVALIQSRPVQQLIEIMQQQQQLQEATSSASTPTSPSTITSPSTSIAPSTTTTTTTTTPAPSTSTSTTTTTQAPSSSTTSTTTREPHLLMISGIRSSKESPLPKRKVMPEIVTYDSFSSKQKGGWRRLVPFDYYPYSDATQLASEMPRSPGIMSETGVEEQPENPQQQHNIVTAHHVMKSVGLSYPVATSSSHLAPSPAPMVDNYRSVGMPGYGSAAQATQVPQLQMPAAAQMVQQQQHQMQPKLPPVVVQYQQPSMSINQQQVQQNALEAAIMNAMMAQQQSQPQKPIVAEMMQMQHVMQQLEAQQQQQQPQSQAMMQLAGMVQQQLQPQIQPQVLQQQQQQVVEEPMSDEIPRPPVGGVKGLFGMPSNKAPNSSLKSPVGGLKIGERPQFDPSNFQMLDTAGQQQRNKQTMAMLQQVLEAAQEQQQQQQQQQHQQQEQQQDQQDLSANASQQSSDVAAKTSGKGGGIEEEARQVKQHPQTLQQAPSPSSGNKGQPTSFSILGGRFKITPHTQMLHYLLEPSKMILQQALNLMGPPPPPPVLMRSPVGSKGRRLPRRGKPNSTSTTRKPTVKANSGKQQLSPSKSTASSSSSSKKKQ